MLCWASFASPIGRIHIASLGPSLCAVGLPNESQEQFLQSCEAHVGPVAGHDDGMNREAKAQLEAYFAGELHEFTVPILLRGTAFQTSVWEALRSIPYGETRTYSEIAAAVGKPVACRAVGAANGQNILPIVVPCHRVIGSGGRLVGFGGGLPLKAALLAIEGVAVADSGLRLAQG